MYGFLTVTPFQAQKIFSTAAFVRNLNDHGGFKFTFLLMRDAELNEIIFNVLVSRIRRESHCTELLRRHVIKRLTKAATKVFEQEKVQLKLSGDFIVVGDIHGNVDDLLQVFKTFNYPPYQKYIFLGDYVDRGKNSIAVIILLYCLKLKFPQHIYLLRGNHETVNISRSYGFKAECTEHLNKRCYKLFCKSFERLPLTAVLNGSIFCVHGGLSPAISYLSEIDALQKPFEDFSKTEAADLVWSDPSSEVDNFRPSPRNSGYLFGANIVDQFLADNDLKMIIRAHEYCPEGFNYTFENCLTVFSASDYQGKNNKSSVAIVSQKSNDVEIHVFEQNLSLEGTFFSFPEWLIENEVNSMKPADTTDPIMDIIDISPESVFVV